MQESLTGLKNRYTYHYFVRRVDNTPYLVKYLSVMGRTKKYNLKANRADFQRHLPIGEYWFTLGKLPEKEALKE